MKIYALYYKDLFVVAFSTREDCVDYGNKKHYDGWDCNILERWIYETEQYPFSQPLTQPKETYISSSPFAPGTK